MKVLVTQEIDPVGVDLLRRAGHEVVQRSGPAPIDPTAFRVAVAGCAAIIPMPTDRVDAALLDASGPSLRVVANHAVGVDNIDRAAAAERGVVVTSTPGVLTDATADMTMALLLAATRHVRAGDQLVREGRFVGWHPRMLCGLELRGARLGIVGMGRIGRAVALRAAAFGMDVVHHSPGRGVSLAALLETSDVVSLHCPLSDETRHLIGAPELQRMRPHAWLVNTSRGPVVHEAALAQALAAGWIAGAALDVFEREPLVDPGLLQRDNVLLAPHLGSATTRARREMARKAALNVISVLAGEGPVDPVG